MARTTDGMAYFERKGESTSDDMPADVYVAGCRSGRDKTMSFEVRLSAELVEAAVLKRSRLIAVLELDGRIVFDAEGLTDAGLEAANTECLRPAQSLETLIRASLDPELLGEEKDAAARLTALRAQIVGALAQVDAALERARRG